MFSLRAENQPEYQEKQKSAQEMKEEAWAKYRLSEISDDELEALAENDEVRFYAKWEQRLRACARDTRTIEQQYQDAGEHILR